MTFEMQPTFDVTPLNLSFVPAYIPLRGTLRWRNKKSNTHPHMEVVFTEGSPTGTATIFRGGKSIELKALHLGSYSYTIRYSDGHGDQLIDGPYLAIVCRNC